MCVKDTQINRVCNKDYDNEPYGLGILQDLE